MNKLPDTLEEALASGLIQRPLTPVRKRRMKDSVEEMLELARQEVKHCDISASMGLNQASVSQTLNRYGKLIWLDNNEIKALREWRRARNNGA